MKINNKFTLVFLLNLMLSILYPYNAYSQTPDNDPTWVLVFEDDFDSTAINSSVWRSYYTWGQKSYQICRIQGTDTTYVDSSMLGYITTHYENCALDTSGNGTVSLVTKKENPPYYGECWDTWTPRLDSAGNVQLNGNGDTIKDPVKTWHYFNYTTAMLRSSASFRYGYFEIKCKLPEPYGLYNGKGLGASFWLFSRTSSVYWNEIDVFEFHCKNNLHTSCVHYQLTDDPNTHWKDRTYPYLEDSIINFNTYHKFSAEWDVEHIYNRIDNDIRRISTPPGEFEAMNIFITSPVPKTWVDDCCLDTVYTIMPYNYQIDYIKVWQLKQKCNTEVNVCNFNTQTYNFAVYKNISLGGSGCNSSINNGENVTLRATESITLNEGFVVNSNATFQASIVHCQEQEVNIPTKLIEQPVPPPKLLEEKQYYE